MKLWLDDVRTPPDNYIVWVKTYKEFVRFVETNGPPDMVSFDHDLGGKKTGYDCAKWLVNKGIKLKNFTVHSANPVGKENIIKLLEAFNERR